MPVFDFHCHPALKPLMSPAGKEPTPWEFIKATLVTSTPLGTIGINRLFNGALNSQSNLAQLFFGKVNLVGVVLYAPENQLGVGVLKKGVAASGKINVLDPAKLTLISRGDNYYQWTKQTVESLINHPLPQPSDDLPAGVNFKFIKSINEYDRNDLSTIHGIAIVEGMHSFANDAFSPNVEADIDTNFSDFIKQFANNNVRLLACNIAHLQQLPFGTHASGLQFIDDSLFYPEGTGLTPLGKRIVKKLHDERVLVDIKHLGFSARFALYAERDIQGFDMPIICTHAGIAGCERDKRFSFLRSQPRMLMTERNGQTVKVWQVEHLKPKGHIKPPNNSNSMSAFNVSSINLYDEDILQILRSGGLIGISLDQRIIGYPADSIGNGINVFPSDVEYVAEADAKVFFGPVDPAQISIFTGDLDEVLSGADAEDHNTFTHDSHARYWINQVIHVLKVAKGDRDPQLFSTAIKRICIGSDFDGLINAIDCCETAESFLDFKDQLSRLMRERHFWEGTGINEGEIDIDDFLEGLFFENAFKFLQENFQ